MSEAEPEGSRLLDTLRRTVAHFQALLTSRLELASVELHEEKYRLARLLFLANAVAVFGLLALTAGTFAVLILTWDTAARAWVLPGFALLYGGLALWSYLRLRNRLKHDSPPFAGTIAEFQKDSAWFSKKS